MTRIDIITILYYKLMGYVNRTTDEIAFKKCETRYKELKNRVSKENL